MAMIGTLSASALSSRRILLLASYPPITGIMTSIRITSKYSVGLSANFSTASCTEAVACCFSGFFAPFVYCALFMFRCYPVFKGLSQPRSEPHASSFRISCPVPWCCTFPCVLSGMPPVLLLFSCRRIRQDCFFLLRCAISERLL